MMKLESSNKSLSTPRNYLTKAGTLKVFKRDGQYGNMVVDFDGELEIITILPNWIIEVDLQSGCKYYFKYKIVKAGDTYFDASEHQEKKYKQDGVYLINILAFEELQENTKPLMRLK